MSGTRGRAGRVPALLCGVLLTAGGLAGCGSEGGPGAAGTSAQPSDPSAGTVTTAEDGVQEVTIESPDDYVFVPDTFTVAPGRVRLTVTSTAEQMTHNFRFRPDAGPEPIAEEIPLLAPGESRTIEFEVTVPGEHPFDCTFHVQLGQSGVMTVSG
ncbi:plastocyanin [Geodermatophilus bullaregiensis]|uniref:cupredoxin domain-containing protein n=1 Tax=Geodermatophilus bullaregiensis TaxID=1564160 RepID=UPI00195A1C70|nr:cupredoxin domain-containing protein [Geodermatophilus bullaregiensis]MBM7807108.1 plastocyanin [Geodermatophilus bullaregiensis]